MFRSGFAISIGMFSFDCRNSGKYGINAPPPESTTQSIFSTFANDRKYENATSYPEINSSAEETIVALSMS